MNRESAQPIIGIVLCVLFFLGYQQYITKKYRQESGSVSTENTLGKEPANSAPSHVSGASVGDLLSGAGEINAPRLTPAELTLENEDIVYKFDQELVAIESIRLKRYQSTRGADNMVELLDGPMVLRGITASSLKPVESAVLARRVDRQLLFSAQSDDWRIVEKVGLGDKGYDLAIDISFTNLRATPQELTGGLWLS